MHTTFGFDGTIRPTDWASVKAGPPTMAVRKHLEKLTTFRPMPGR
ncbi:MAG TPA: hypothetical protein VMP03_02620 [Methylomirabilota bacterium]|nr:hypothetical protein [Methylomirabilota bacterium]